MDTSELDAKIRNRNSWLRVGVAVVFLAILAWKAATTSLALTNVDFPTLLSIVVSLFSIGLAVAFYFKATETSNTFYDNSYRFTKEISEILGRIEAGFGERLRHLDEGYSGLRESVARMPADEKATKADLAEREERIKALEKEKAESLAQLAARARLQDSEKKTLLDSLTKKDSELRQARAETAALRRHLVTDASRSQPVRAAEKGTPIDEALRRVTEYTQHSVLRLFGGADTTAIPDPIFRERFAELRDALHPAYLNDLKALGFVTGDNHLTDSGIRWLKRLMRQAAEKPTPPPPPSGDVA